MSVQVIDSYISDYDARMIIDGFSPHLVASGRIGMAEAQYADPVKAINNIYEGKPIIDNEESLEAAALFTETVNKIAKEISEFYNVEAVPASSIFAEVSQGGKNGLHCDSVMIDGTPWPDNDDTLDGLEFSALLYLNTSGVDYEGGQIVFPNQKITITPEVGKLIFFRGDIDHPHEVSEVTAGTRYALVLFYGSADKVKQYQRFKSKLNFGGI